MIYLKIIWAWFSSLKSRFKTGEMLDIRESSHRQRDLVRNAKVIKETKEIKISFKPFKFKMNRVRIYDSYNKVNVNNKNVDILLEDKMPYGN